MKQKISPKLISAAVSILTILFAVGFYISAWTEPSAAPPLGNVPTPLNIGNVGQAKEGGLILNTSGAPNGLIVDKGNVGIGTTGPGEKLEVSGNIKLSGAVPTYKITNVITPTDGSDGSDVATKAYVDAAAGGGGTLINWAMTQVSSDGSWSCGSFPLGIPPAGQNTQDCPAGWTEVYKGYGPYWLYDRVGGNSIVVAVSEICGSGVLQVAPLLSGYSAPAVDGGPFYGRACHCYDLVSDVFYCNTCRVCVK